MKRKSTSEKGSFKFKSHKKKKNRMSMKTPRQYTGRDAFNERTSTQQNKRKPQAFRIVEESRSQEDISSQSREIRNK